MTTKEKIEVMHAYLDGKQIQTRLIGERNRWATWKPKKEPVWDFWHCEYRIKPEPRIPIEEWRVLYKDGAWSPPFGIACAAKAFLNAIPGADRVVHFREVVEDDQS